MSSNNRTGDLIEAIMTIIVLISAVVIALHFIKK
jgi:hypothetical protein